MAIAVAQQFRAYAAVVALCHTHAREHVLERFQATADPHVARIISEETSKFYLTNRAFVSVAVVIIIFFFLPPKGIYMCKRGWGRGYPVVLIFMGYSKHLE